MRLFARRQVWVPTVQGTLLLFTLAVLPLAGWFGYGERFLSHTAPVPADVLIVEGWIGIEGMHAAATEFTRADYHVIVATGALSSEVWNDHRASYAEMARYELARAGVPADKVLAATSRDVDSQRTYEMAVAAAQCLAAHALHPTSVNVFTRGVHARRSQLVFAKVLGPTVRVGAIAWVPARTRGEPWWQSSERAQDFAKESFGYVFERVLGSARWALPPPREHFN